MRSRQRGIALVLVALGLLAVFALAALAIDIGHLVLNKARLQNAVDAAALTAAKVVDQTTSTLLATAAANAAFDRNAGDNPEVSDARGGIVVTIEYSSALQPFVVGSEPARFARVRAGNFSFLTTFARVISFGSLVTHASAVAGPTPLGPAGDVQVCDMLPILACGLPVAGAPDWGIALGQLTVLKVGSGSIPGAVGPGNFQLLDAGSGGSAIRDALAGKPWKACASVGDTVITDPGDKVGPVDQGLNTRFDPPKDPNYPPDVLAKIQPALKIDYDNKTGVVSYDKAPVNNVAQIGFSFANNYVPLLKTPPAYSYAPPTGAFNRREIVVPVGDCTGTNNGKSNPVTVLGFACFFLLQPTGHTGGSSYIVGEHITSCPGHGNPGPGPGTGGGPGPYVIQLYRDYSSPDS